MKLKEVANSLQSYINAGYDLRVKGLPFEPYETKILKVIFDDKMKTPRIWVEGENRLMMDLHGIISHIYITDMYGRPRKIFYWEGTDIISIFDCTDGAIRIRYPEDILPGDLYMENGEYRVVLNSYSMEYKEGTPEYEKKWWVDRLIPDPCEEFLSQGESYQLSSELKDKYIAYVKGQCGYTESSFK